MDLSDKVIKLLEEQITEWPLANRNYSGLKKVLTRSIKYEGFELLIQFNPERIRSSAAKVDKQSIAARPCFLCQKNLPDEQYGIPILNKYLILINPFPIFPQHLTIPHLEHLDQHIKDKFEDMLALSQILKRFVIFYNGPECGASAPDHFHFQAGNKGFLPIEKDFILGHMTEVKANIEGVHILIWNNYRRSVISLYGQNKSIILKSFEKIWNGLSEMQPERIEPLMNVLVYTIEDNWVVHIFPRKLHRPYQYFEKGDRQIVLSPAAVDLGGVLITPREEDFYKLRKEEIEDIYQQVCLSENKTTNVINLLI